MLDRPDLLYVDCVAKGGEYPGTDVVIPSCACSPEFLSPALFSSRIADKACVVVVKLKDIVLGLYRQL